jgi:MFS family permease
MQDGIGKNPSLVKNTNFLLFLSSRSFSTLAYQMLAVAIGWHAYFITHSVFFLGLIGLFQFIPMFLLTIPVGHAADKFHRRFLALSCQVIEAILVVFLAVTTLFGHTDKYILLGVITLLAAARAFEGPSMQALMPALVDEEAFPRAAAWSSASFQAASILGPAVGGLLFAVKPEVVYFTAAVLISASAFSLGFIRHEHKTRTSGPVSISSLFAGIHFIFSRRAILGSISLDLFAVLLGGATALLPYFADKVLFVGPAGLGLLRAAPAIGALIVSFFLARRPVKKNAGRTMFAAVAVFGLATIVFALSRSFWLSLFSLIVLGAADVFSVVIRSTLVQIGTPDDMRGRVSSVNSLFIGTSNQLGEFESGLTAAWFGTVPAVLIGGLGTLVVAVLWMKLFPELRKLDSLSKSSIAATTAPNVHQPG